MGEDKGEWERKKEEEERKKKHSIERRREERDNVVVMTKEKEESVQKRKEQINEKTKWKERVSQNARKEKGPLVWRNWPVGPRSCCKGWRKRGREQRAAAEGRNQMLRLGIQGSRERRERTMDCGAQLAAS